MKALPAPCAMTMAKAISAKIPDRRNAGTRATADIAGSIAAAPVSLTGNAELSPEKAESPEKNTARLAFRAEVEVRVPLVGRKLENFISNQLVDLLSAEQRFTTSWIAEMP